MPEIPEHYIDQEALKPNGHLGRDLPEEWRLELLEIARIQASSAINLMEYPNNEDEVDIDTIPDDMPSNVGVYIPFLLGRSLVHVAVHQDEDAVNLDTHSSIDDRTMIQIITFVPQDGESAAHMTVKRSIIDNTGATFTVLVNHDLDPQDTFGQGKFLLEPGHTPAASMGSTKIDSNVDLGFGGLLNPTLDLRSIREVIVCGRRPAPFTSEDAHMDEMYAKIAIEGANPLDLIKEFRQRLEILSM